jgi:hypothetical protein
MEADMEPIGVGSFQTFMLACMLFLFVLYVLQSSWFNGFVGELAVHLSLKIHLNTEKYHLQRKVALSTADGTFWIDRIIVSEHGVFVIETQNRRGWIFGGAHRDRWTQRLWRYSRDFQNPLDGNRQRVEKLKSMLELSDKQIFSVVVFVGSSDFQTRMPENVVNGRDLIRYIKSNDRQVILSSDVPMILSTIEAARLPSSRERPAAPHDAGPATQRLAEKTTGQCCPQCGSPVVVREEINGVESRETFVGCTRFPECRGTVLISVEVGCGNQASETEPVFTDSWAERSWREDDRQPAFTDRAFG